jgi:hypothetical protein
MQLSRAKLIGILRRARATIHLRRRRVIWRRFVFVFNSAASPAQSFNQVVEYALLT